MLQECLEGMNIVPNGIYVDVTFGGGGHSKAILKKIEDGMLYSFDQDPDAKANAAALESSSFTLVESNFRYLKRYLKLYGVKQVQGILADLGVSSHQIDAPERGFSTRFDGVLDMRMAQSGEKNAAKILNEYSEKELHRIFGMYGEVRNAKTLAALIVSSRVNHPFKMVLEFKDTIRKLAPRGKENRYFAQVFQALRIEVNEEMQALEEMLEQCAEVLAPGGRLVVMSYHSLEDRLVKNFINKGKFFGEAEKDFYGNVLKPFEAISRKPIVAQKEEIETNNRARSAKLRIASKV